MRFQTNVSRGFIWRKASIVSGDIFIIWVKLQLKHIEFSFERLLENG